MTAREAWIAVTPRLERVPRGSADLMAALLLGHLVLGRALPEALALSASAVHCVLAASVDEPELRLIAERQRLLTPPFLQVDRVFSH